jgi:hypothetical protein
MRIWSVGPWNERDTHFSVSKVWLAKVIRGQAQTKPSTNRAFWNPIVLITAGVMREMVCFWVSEAKNVAAISGTSGNSVRLSSGSMLLQPVPMHRHSM